MSSVPLARTKRGMMIHHRDCRYASMGKPWLWADDQPDIQIAIIALEFGYQTCLHCRPLENVGSVRKVL